MRTMTKILLAGAAAFLMAVPAQAQSVVFLSTQLRPIEEAQKVRDVLLKGGPATQFVTEEPARLNTRVEAEAQAGTRSFSLIGALHGEISGLPTAVLDPVRKATGERKLGFPAGPTGLMARFFQGYLYPSYTGGVVSTFKSAEAEQMWGAFKGL